MISYQQVTKRYGKSPTPAVNNLSFAVNPGEIVGFLGPNGAGKTTTIKMTVGLTRPDSGHVLVNDIDVQKNPLAVKQIIGYVPDSPEPFGRLTGREYVRFMADVFKVSKEERERRIPELLARFDLEDAFNDKLSGYSRGMKQKVTIIGSLIHNPDVWILDEPMVGLDPKSSHTLKETMRQHCDTGKVVLFSTHVLEVAERLCDRVLIINHGQLLASGTIDELRQQKGGGDSSLESLFLELTAQ